jgi:hypothetical protein
MKYQIVDNSNIDILYKLNKQLAIDENQASLFVAKKKNYKKSFISKKPIAYGILVYKNDTPIGFIIFVNKFATYLASKVLFIEDIYLINKYCTKKNMNKLLKYIIKKSKVEHYARVELRVLRNYSFDKTIIKKNRFKKIKKWDTYRYE